MLFEEYLPAGMSLHLGVVTVPPLYLPEAHVPQTDALVPAVPCDIVDDPAGQSVHAEAPDAEYDPFGQGLHASAEVEPTSLNVPDGQGVVPVEYGLLAPIPLRVPVFAQVLPPSFEK